MSYNMDTFSVDKCFYEDIAELWDSDMEPIQVMQDVLRAGGDVTEVAVSECWGSTSTGTLLDTKPPGAVVLHDRLMTDAALGAVPIKTEHSYSLTSDGDSMPESPISLETMDDDMDEEILMAIPMNCATQHRDRGRPESPASILDIKQEPLSSPSSPSSDEDASSAISVGGNESPIHMPEHTFIKQEPQPMSRVMNTQQSLLKQPTIFVTTRNNVFNQQGRVVIPKLNIKVESNGSGFSLPPTPPSSTTSDSEGNVSPMHASPPSPLTAGGVRTLNSRQGGTRLYLSSSASNSAHCRQPIQTPLISTQPKGSTGSLFLTEEEKRTLLAEGYPIPTRLPLTKAEEKSLKKIRRKIKNKISAQESRRKKKEYMDALEKRVENLVSENCEYKKKIESLEGSNTSLLSQLQKLQAMLGQTGTSTNSTLTNGRSRTSAATSHHFTRNSLK